MNLSKLNIVDPSSCLNSTALGGPLKQPIEMISVFSNSAAIATFVFSLKY